MTSSKKLPSERSFGFLLVVVLAGLGAYAWYHEGLQNRVYGWFGAALCAGLIAIVTPGWLAPFNKAWFLIGEVLGRIVSPIVLGVIFFGLLTPIGFLLRLLGRDELRLKKRSGNSYWVERHPPGPASESFRYQF